MSVCDFFQCLNCNDEECINWISTQPLGIVAVFNDTVEANTNWAFETLSGDCGDSFVKAGNSTACFLPFNYGNFILCETRFERFLDERSIYIYIDMVQANVGIYRIPLPLTYRFVQTSVPFASVAIGDGSFNLEMELGASRRCLDFPTFIRDGDDGIWNLTTSESVCNTTISSIYTRTFTPPPSSSGLATASFGGPDSFCALQTYCFSGVNGNVIEAQFEIGSESQFIPIISTVPNSGILSLILIIIVPLLIMMLFLLAICLCGKSHKSKDQ